MNKAFEKILEKLEEEKIRLKTVRNNCIALSDKEVCGIEDKAYTFCKKIVHEVAEKYNCGWIPCSERLPEKNGMYLCTQNTYDLATNKNIIRVSTELVEFYNGKWRRAKNLVITHWQPLPEQYKQEEK